MRRASTKCISAVAAVYSDLLPDIYRRAAAELVARFREREENVKTDVFHAYTELVKQIGATAARYTSDGPNR